MQGDGKHTSFHATGMSPIRRRHNCRSPSDSEIQIPPQFQVRSSQISSQSLPASGFTRLCTGVSRGEKLVTSLVQNLSSCTASPGMGKQLAGGTLSLFHSCVPSPKHPSLSFHGTEALRTLEAPRGFSAFPKTSPPSHVFPKHGKYSAKSDLALRSLTFHSSRHRVPQVGNRRSRQHPPRVWKHRCIPCGKF